MKKSLIALAVMVASGAALAQSSVTLYGVADAGIGKIESGSGGKSPANDASNKTEFLSASKMNNGDSRLGVRGVEDLGGGLKAGFTFETGLDLDNGAATSSAFWSRGANLWLGGGWGRFTMGREYPASYDAGRAWELTGAANYSVISNTYGWAGAGSRNNSQFKYTSPNFGGFSAMIGYMLKADNGDRAKWDLGLKYANGPIGVGLGVNKVKDGKTNYALGGKYNFGSFALAASYNQTSSGSLRRRGYSLGGQAKFNAFTVTLDLTRDSKNEIGGKKFTNGVLEGKYALSKRTFVYAAYLRLDGDNNYGIGIRHNF